MPGGAGSPLAGGAVAGCEADPRRVKGGRFPYGRAELVKELPALLVSLFRRGDVPGEAGGVNTRGGAGAGGAPRNGSIALLWYLRTPPVTVIVCVSVIAVVL